MKISFEIRIRFFTTYKYTYLIKLNYFFEKKNCVNYFHVFVVVSVVSVVADSVIVLDSDVCVDEWMLLVLSLSFIISRDDAINNRFVGIVSFASFASLPLVLAFVRRF